MVAFLDSSVLWSDAAIGSGRKTTFRAGTIWNLDFSFYVPNINPDSPIFHLQSVTNPFNSPNNGSGVFLVAWAKKIPRTMISMHPTNARPAYIIGRRQSHRFGRFFFSEKYSGLRRYSSDSRCV